MKNTPSQAALRAAEAILIDIHWQGVRPTHKSDLEWLEMRKQHIAQLIDYEFRSKDGDVQ